MGPAVSPENCCPVFGETACVTLGDAAVLGLGAATGRTFSFRSTTLQIRHRLQLIAVDIHVQHHAYICGKLLMDSPLTSPPSSPRPEDGISTYLQTTDCLNLGYLEQDVRIHRSFSSYRSTTFPAHHAIVVVWANCILQSGEQCYLFLFP